jgi:hypothetical protein
LDQTAVKRLIKSVKNVLKEEIGLLKLVPEEEISLRELEFLEVIFLHEWNSEDIGGGKEPASTRLTLVCDGIAFKWNLYVEPVGYQYDETSSGDLTYTC